ncbi:helix-turn-helix transcriptional regulator [Ponticaulis profundi]|uniref:LuxR C-terminal-related transcriptional regulator n=1 Tax=Ponticaulis profundi TaxID=2665222 RepID=A0ABW1SC86_9PROT
MDIEQYILNLSEMTSKEELVGYFTEQSTALGAGAVGGYPLIYGETREDSGWQPYVTTFPKKIRDFYREFAAMDDPFMEAALVKGSPVQYSRVRDQMRWNDVQIRFFNMLEEVGLRDGVGTPVCPKPGVVAYFVIAFPDVRPEMSWPELRKIYLYFNEFFIRYWKLSESDRVRVSMRERQILVGIMKGKSKAEISETLGLSAHTIDTYTRRCFEKLKVKNRTEAAVKAFGLGLAYSDSRIDEG